MKRIDLNRLLMMILIFIISGFGYAQAGIYSQEEIKHQEDPTIAKLNEIEIVDVFCTEPDPSKVFIILDQHDRIITQGKCTDVMVKFFIGISDPLLEVDNIKYFRLTYGVQLMQNELRIQD